MKKLFLIVLLFPFFGIIPPCTFAEMIGTNFVRLMGKSSPEAPMKIWKRVIWIGAESTIFPRSKCSKSLREEKPKDYHLLLTWLEQGTQYNGFYLLGL